MVAAEWFENFILGINGIKCDLKYRSATACHPFLTCSVPISPCLQKARDLLCPYGVQVIARNTRWMKIHHFTNLLNLGASSVEPPLFLEINYCGDTVGTTKPYMFIGAVCSPSVLV